MPFGVNVAQEEFQCRLQEKLTDLDGVRIIRDDILVVGHGDTDEEDEADHEQNLRKLLERARAVNFKLNSKKMNLKQPQVKFMGHVLSNEGLKPDPDKVRAVTDMPKPTSKKETLSLLGFINYLARFLPRMSEVAQPIRELTIANARFIWSPQHDRAFDEVKTLVVSHPVLKHYDVGEEVTVQMGCERTWPMRNVTTERTASRFRLENSDFNWTGLGVRSDRERMLKYCFACTKFSQYISRRDNVTVECDHKPLQSIFKKSLLHAPCRLQRIMLRLERYNIDVTYKPETQMCVSDHSSSRAFLKNTGPDDDEFQVFALEVEKLSPFNTLKVSGDKLTERQHPTEQDPVLQTLKSVVQTGWPEQREQVPVETRAYWNFREELTPHIGIMLKNNRIIIPTLMRPDITS